MSLTHFLSEALAQGIHQIGQLRFFQNHEAALIVLCHLDNAEQVAANKLDGLTIHRDPDAARELGLYTPEGEYRFTKGELTLSGGWVILLENVSELRRSLDLFYPASLGLWAAWKQDAVRVQNLRDKLNRQTGMYRHSRNVSDEGAQHLVQTICGPANKCVKKVLWQLDSDTPLADSEASQFNGILNETPPDQAIPLLCQEACNFFVAQCRKQSKKEFEESQE